MDNRIERDELKTRIDRQDPITLLEALPQRSFDQGHLPGARRLWDDGLDAARAAAVIPDKTTEVVVYCASATCANSHTLARRLGELGYQHVRVYAGGKADWTDAGWPLEG